MILVYVLNMYY